MKGLGRMVLMVVAAALILAACSISNGGDSELNVVVYDRNGATGGTVPIDSGEYAVGDTVTVLGNTGSLVKSGYTYTGWNTQADGSGTTRTQGETFSMGTSTARLYAKWTLNSVPTYTVTYNANGATGGTAPTDSTNYEAGQTVTVLGNTGSLVRTGYTFAGWNTQTDGGGTDRAPGSTFVMGSTDVTLYAKWAGYQESYTAGGITFKMSFVPGYTGFPTGTDDLGTATVASPYWMAETEVTYELWYAVRDWAALNGYTFANQGMEGHDGSTGFAPTPAKNEPVTTINWRDALIWCNALTEWYNANNGSEPDLDPVYYTDSAYTNPLRIATNNGTIDTNQGSEDLPYVKAAAVGNTDQSNCTANGFRLPGSMEWELAARWRTDSTNTVASFSDPWFTQGDSASGAALDYNDAGASGTAAWYNANSGGVTHDVKGKTANSLGLYDMSGNVREWSFDWHPSYIGSRRGERGGSWVNGADFLQAGYVYNDFPYYGDDFIGFRFTRTP